MIVIDRLRTIPEVPKFLCDNCEKVLEHEEFYRNIIQDETNDVVILLCKPCEQELYKKIGEVLK